MACHRLISPLCPSPCAHPSNPCPDLSPRCAQSARARGARAHTEKIQPHKSAPSNVCLSPPHSTSAPSFSGTAGTSEVPPLCHRSNRRGLLRPVRPAAARCGVDAPGPLTEAAPAPLAPSGPSKHYSKSLQNLYCIICAPRAPLGSSLCGTLLNRAVWCTVEACSAVHFWSALVQPVVWWSA